jgi:hypothetical protein
MKSTIRLAVLVAAFTTAGCVSKVEGDQVSYREMHAAIPASKISDNVFEYGSMAEGAQVGVAAPSGSTLSYAEMHAAIPASQISGNVFEYN